MARKGSLIAAMKATSDQLAAEAAQVTETAPVVVQEVATPEPEVARARAPGAAMVTTAIHIPKETHDLLRRVAVERAVDHGGRPSVSAVLTELVKRHWDELAGEAGR